jgi:hypothetical protein
MIRSRQLAGTGCWGRIQYQPVTQQLVVDTRHRMAIMSLFLSLTVAIRNFLVFYAQGFIYKFIYL